MIYTKVHQQRKFHNIRIGKVKKEKEKREKKREKPSLSKPHRDLRAHPHYIVLTPQASITPLVTDCFGSP